MIKSFLSAIALMVTFSAAHAEPAKKIQPIVCEGEVGSAHTLTVGKCSFTGEPGKKVYDACKEDQLCHVDALGWNNGHGMFIVTMVATAQRIEHLTPPLSAEELAMARACKPRKPCSLTCNRAHDAGRDDLIEAGRCAE